MYRQVDFKNATPTRVAFWFTLSAVAIRSSPCLT